MPQVIDFAPGITERFPSLRDVCKHAVENCNKQQKYIALDLGLTPSALTNALKLRRGDAEDRNFDIDLLPALIESTENPNPIFWLIEKCMQSPAERLATATEEMSQLLPKIVKLLAEATAALEQTKGRS